VLGRLGAGSDTGVVLAAHLDTVFAADVEHRVMEADGRLVGPGVTDNARGLAALLALAYALTSACEPREATLPAARLSRRSRRPHGGPRHYVRLGRSQETPKW